MIRARLTFVVGLLLAISFQSHSAEPGFKELFNGKDLTGWQGDERFWSVEDGAITGRSTPENVVKPNTFLVWTDGTLDDFVLRLAFRIQPDNEKGQANSGIQYRSQVLDDKKWVVGGYQADFEAGKTYSGILYEERGRGILAQRGDKVSVLPGAGGGKPTVQVTGKVGDSAAIQAAIRPGEWNDYEIEARGNHLIHRINGLTTVDVTDLDTAHAARSGVLGLQLHQGPPMTVQFRNVRVKRVKLAQGKKLVMIAGKPSHPPLMHEFNAGIQLLDKCLANERAVVTARYLNGWPRDPSAFDNADGIFFYMDGRQRHEAVQGDRLAFLEKLVARGVGMGCAHYAVEVDPEVAGDQFKRWIGGHYENGFSVNPMWEPDFQDLPDHPITRGVNPFQIKDEWYFNMRFRPGMKGVKAILAAVPSDDVRDGPYVYPKGPYEHIVAASGRKEVMMWTVEREDGGRGFGFTGGHFHLNWGNDDFRKVVLNALVWMAGAEVPKKGVASSVTERQLMENLDPKHAPKPRSAAKK